MTVLNSETGNRFVYRCVTGDENDGALHGTDLNTGTHTGDPTADHIRLRWEGRSR